jgi:AP-4 complex subunit mu-1
MSISQFFILSARGDTIIYRDFRKDLKKGINELFFRKVAFWKDEGGEAPPIFNIEGINFIFFKKFEMYFVFATKENNSPSYYLEILWGLMKVIKDHCGIISEESIRKNFILIYEIVDEILDFGYPQLSSTEQVKPFVFTEPIAVVKPTSIMNTDFKIFKKESVPSQANQRTMGQAVDQKNKKFS